MLVFPPDPFEEDENLIHHAALILFVVVPLLPAVIVAFSIVLLDSVFDFLPDYFAKSYEYFFLGLAIVFSIFV